MTSRIEYRFKSKKKPSFIVINGNYVSINQLTLKIIENEKLPPLTEITLLIENAQSHQMYTNPNEFIYKNTSVIISRLPKLATPEAPPPAPAPAPVVQVEEAPEQAPIAPDQEKQVDYFYLRPNIPTSFIFRPTRAILPYNEVTTFQQLDDPPLKSGRWNLEDLVRWTCPKCHRILREAVLTPCCSTAYCDSCITEVLISDEASRCPNEGCRRIGVFPTMLIPATQIREELESWQKFDPEKLRFSDKHKEAEAANQSARPSRKSMTDEDYEDGRKRSQQSQRRTPFPDRKSEGRDERSGDRRSYERKEFSEGDRYKESRSEKRRGGEGTSEERREYRRDRAPPRDWEREGPSERRQRQADRYPSDRRDGQQERRDGQSDRRDGQQERRDGQQERRDGQQDRRDGQSDRRDGQSDRKDGQQDRRDVQQDRKDVPQERRESQQDRRDGQSDRKDVPQERRESQQDRRDGQSDRRDGQQDRSQRPPDKYPPERRDSRPPERYPPQDRRDAQGRRDLPDRRDTNERRDTNPPERRDSQDRRDKGSDRHGPERDRRPPDRRDGGQGDRRGGQNDRRGPDRRDHRY